MDTHNQDNPQPLYTFQRTPQEEVRFSIREYENQIYMDIRIWFRPQGATEEFVPTRKGILLKLDQVDHLRRGVNDLTRAASEHLESRPPKQGSRPRNMAPAMN